MRHFAITVALLLHYTMAGPADISVSQASNSFATQLYQELAKTPGNVLVCPVSLHIALALVHQGSGGTTASELSKVLRLSGSNDNIRNNYKALLTGLQDNVLKLATKLYPAISFKPKPDFVSVAQQYFLSDIQALDYGKSVDAANTINKFVENKTNNKIHDIISPDSLTDLTRLVIVNAVHFKANWAKTFPPAYTGNFKVTPAESVETKFMSQTDYFPYKEDRVLGAKVLKMDYENGVYSMVFVLPTKEDGLAELETKLASTSMDSVLSGLQDERVEVTIPKFKIEQTMQLKDVLAKMGIVSMFDSRADLSNVAEGEKLYVDSVIQKTFIDVNEKGTEAAAATGIITPLSGGSEEYTFSARRPFHYYLIRNKTPLVILFNGRFVKPQEKEKSLLKESSHNPTDKDATDGELNRFGNQHGVISQNQGGVFNNGYNYYTSNPAIYPEQNVGQNFNQQNQWQNGPINRFNQNNYQVPQSSSLSNFGQNSQAVNEFSQRPNFQTEQLNKAQYVQNEFSQPQRQQESFLSHGPQTADQSHNPHNSNHQYQSYYQP